MGKLINMLKTNNQDLLNNGMVTKIKQTKTN